MTQITEEQLVEKMAVTDLESIGILWDDLSEINRRTHINTYLPHALAIQKRVNVRLFGNVKILGVLLLRYQSDRAN
jgi:hypothetical protein